MSLYQTEMTEAALRHFTPDELALARALRDASALRRAPTPGQPDGIHRMHLITELSAERWLPDPDHPVQWHRVARRLVSKGWAGYRTLHGSRRYGLTEVGEARLRTAEAALGRTIVVLCQQQVNQATHDLESARRAVQVYTETRRLALSALAQAEERRESDVRDTAGHVLSR